VNDDDTPETLDLEEGDSIEVALEREFRRGRARVGNIVALTSDYDLGLGGTQRSVGVNHRY